MPQCCVSGCTGAQKAGVKSYMFPKVNHQTETFQKLSIQRRDAWLTALGKTNSDAKSYEKLQICDSHFISGKMAALQDVNNMDWVPTMNLRHTRNSSDILRCSIDGCVVSNQGGQCSFYRISKTSACGELKQVSEIKLSAWISALALRSDVPATCENIYVCHAHYIIDMSAKLRNTSNKETRSGAANSSEISTNHSKAAGNIPRALASRKRVKSISPEKKSKFFKSGDILRNENGQFSYSCGYCNAINDDCRAMVNHINTHFDKTKKSKISISRLPSPEFVSCTITDDETMEPECSETFRELTNSMSKPKAPDESTTFTISYVKPEHINSRPLKRLSPKVNIDDLIASRPCKIERVKTMETIDVTSTTKSSTLPVKFKPIRIPPLPAELVEKWQLPKASRSPGWCFGKNYEIKYKNPNSTVGKNSTIKPENATVHLTSSKDRHETNDKCNTVILKCSQCKLEPGVDVSDPSPHMQCKECDEWFPNHITYRTHFLDTHRTARCYQCEMEPSIIEESDPRRHKCAMCKDFFPNHAEFRTHLIDDHDEYVTDNDFNSFANDYKEFNCYICEKTLKQREYLVFHMKGHFEKYLEYQCHLCGLRLRSESVLKEHMKRHDNTPTKCDLCDKTFPNSLRMRTHRMCHSSELNHVCPICSKGFKLSKYLSRHMAMHNEVKIGCRYCDATFKFSTGRRAHEKSVHNVL